MSFEAVDLVLRSKVRDRSRFNVLLALAFFSNPQSSQCNPSTELIAEVARLSPNVVRKAIKELETSGLISSSQEPGKVRFFSLKFDRIATLLDSRIEGNSTSDTPSQSDTPFTTATPLESESTPLSEVKGEPFQKCEGTPSRSERGPLSEVKAEQVIEQVIEQDSIGSTDPKSKLDNTKAKRDPPVKCPNPIPKEWIEEAKALRRDIDVAALANKFVCYYAPTTTRKALKNWKRTWTGWVGREKPKRVDLNKPQDWVFKHYSAEDYNTDFD